MGNKRPDVTFRLLSTYATGNDSSLLYYAVSCFHTKG